VTVSEKSSGSYSRYTIEQKLLLELPQGKRDRPLYVGDRIEEELRVFLTELGKKEELLI
jgi:hypothetical protein